MRKLIYSMTVSLDGFIAGPDGAIDWSVPDDELFRFHTQQVQEIGVHLCGRRLYETMVYWETAEASPLAADQVAFAQIWKALPKVVFSTTLQSVVGNTRLASGGVGEEVSRLKEQPGKDIAVGGAGLARICMELGLIDEYRLFVSPVVLGAGTPYFPALEERMSLELVETQTFGSRVVYLRYSITDNRLLATGYAKQLLTRALIDLVERVRAIPYGRPSDRTIEGMLREQRGTCSTKHLYLAQELMQRFPATEPQIMHRVYKLDRDDAERLFGSRVAETIPPDGLVDVHRYLTIKLEGQQISIDATFPGKSWDGHSSMPLACGPGTDIPSTGEPDHHKQNLEANHCDPAIREPFIAALATQAISPPPTPNALNSPSKPPDTT